MLVLHWTISSSIPTCCSSPIFPLRAITSFLWVLLAKCVERDVTTFRFWFFSFFSRALSNQMCTSFHCFTETALIKTENVLPVVKSNGQLFPPFFIWLLGYHPHWISFCLTSCFFSVLLPGVSFLPDLFILRSLVSQFLVLFSSPSALTFSPTF